MNIMNSTPKVVEWGAPPLMDSGAPMPAIYSDETGLTCAYLMASQSEVGSTAVVHFEGVLYYAMGYPNDETLHAHPLYANGLKFYRFHLVENSPLIADLDRRNQIHGRHVAGAYIEQFRHWIITFHDETLEVVARAARIVGCTNKQPRASVRLSENNREAIDG